MGDFAAFVLIYTIGGLTFLPLVICIVALHAHLTFPHVPDLSQHPSVDAIGDAGDDGHNMRSGGDAAALSSHHDQEKEFGGYFAVCREWIPGGINGKPPERTTPAGEVIAEESPSVYQSMYRSLFDRKQVPTIEAGRVNGKPTKRARNVFYIVLRHGHLMLYDDSEQVEVRHVVSLAHHQVGVHAGGEDVPEGELWIKRNAICLTRKTASSDDLGPVSKPFYLFSENCSEKEDFYFALIQNQEREPRDEQPPPLAQRFEINHIIGLVQKLHSSEEQLQTRWLNALIGRLFLSLYKTQQVEDIIRKKITKKISRVKKPAFLSGIVLRKIDMGNAAPFITNPRLKDLTVEGECVVEADVKYSGSFRIEIATTARIDLGVRIKAREVNLVLAISLEKLEGHLLVRLKPPPSNRVWTSFETMPQLQMKIEPVVSSRQITYGVILRAIESRIREVVAETIVLPHWDDSPFLNTLGEVYRGGVWMNERTNSHQATETIVPDEVPEDTAESGRAHGSPFMGDHSISVPVLVEDQQHRLLPRKGLTTPHSPTANHNKAISSGVARPVESPRAIRSKSFASAASPIVSTDHINSNPTRKELGHSKDAASFMTEISNRSQPTSPVGTPSNSANPPSAERGKDAPPQSRISDCELGSSHLTLADASDTLFSKSPPSLSLRSTASSIDSASTKPSRLQNVARGLTPSENRQQSLSAAAVAAKNWGWKTFTKGKGIDAAVPERSGTPDNPIGRGRPLPPPGQPLPLPGKRTSATSFILAHKRKPLPASSTLEQSFQQNEPPKMPFHVANEIEHITPAPDASDSLLVVEAPHESEPSSPVAEWGEFQDNVSPEDDMNEASDSQQNMGDASACNSESSEAAGALDCQIQGNMSHPTSFVEDDAHGPASWQTAQEEEARSQSIWMDEREYS